MSWVKRTIRRWLEEDGSERGVYATAVKSIDSEIDSSEGYTLKVYPARGGRVIQYYKYDRQKDRANTSLYVISDTEDLGEAVKNIVVEQALQGN
jgi:hypothetical protein